MQTAFVPLGGGLSVKFVGLRPSTCTLPKTTGAQPLVAPRAVPTAKLFDWKKRADPDHAKVGGDGMFYLDNLKPAPGSNKRKTRKGRGHGAGQGGSCGFGMRGQKSRSGRPTRPGFEGGQTPLYRRVPKFTGRPTGPGHTKTEYALMKIEFLNGVEENSIVTFESLKEAGLMTKQKRKLVKVTGGAELNKKGLTVKAHAFTSSAVEAIEGAGGKCVLVSPTTGKDIVIEEEEE